MSAQWFFHGWSDLLRVAVVGTAVYLGVVLLLRISGKRTLAKLNAFDLVVTVALGSILGGALLSESVSASEGIVAVAVLVALQFLISWLSVRSDAVRKLTRAQPALLVYRGQFLRDAMRRERVTDEEVRSAIRAAGLAGLEEVQAVVIESEGELTVIRQDQDGSEDLLNGVRKPKDLIAS